MTGDSGNIYMLDLQTKCCPRPSASEIKNPRFQGYIVGYSHPPHMHITLSNDHTLWEGCSATECAAGSLRGRSDFKTLLNVILKTVKGNFCIRAEISKEDEFSTKHLSNL